MSHPDNERYPPSEWRFFLPDGSSRVETVYDQRDFREIFRQLGAVEARPAQWGETP